MYLTNYYFIMAILAFIPIYYSVPKRHQKSLLLIASLIFYANVGVGALALLLGLSAFSYLLGHAVEKNKKTVVFTPFLLLPFIAARMFQLFDQGWVVPLGVTFYTLQMMGYVFDIQRGQSKAESHFLRFLSTTTYFPQLIQGPIQPYVLMQKSHVEYRAENVSLGLHRMLWGYFKKLVIADRLAIVVSTLANHPDIYNGPYVLLLMIVYTAQLYADFSGGIDIVIGFSKCLGFTLLENFNRPFAAKTVTEFWRRWHITLGDWFKNYVFYPVTTHPQMLSFSRGLKQKLGPAISKRVPIYIGTLLVWALTGLWHGFQWHFLLGGLLNGVVVLLELEFRKRERKVKPVVAIARTLVWVSAVRLLDVYKSVSTTVFMLMNMFEAPLGSISNLGLTQGDVWVIGLAYGVVIIRASKGSNFEDLKPYTKILLVSLLFWSVVLFGVHGTEHIPQQFIYGRF